MQSFQFGSENVVVSFNGVADRIGSPPYLVRFQEFPPFSAPLCVFLRCRQRGGIRCFHITATIGRTEVPPRSFLLFLFLSFFGGVAAAPLCFDSFCAV